MSTPEQDSALPDETTLAQWATSYFREAPEAAPATSDAPLTSAAPVTSAAPPAPAVPLTPVAPVAPPAPAVAPRLHSEPPHPSSIGAAHPVPGLAASVVDVPRVPLVPEDPYGIAPRWPFAMPEVPLHVDATHPPIHSFEVSQSLPDHAGAQVFAPELVPHVGATAVGFDPHLARRDFPILKEKVNGKDLVWLDNAATTQKPQAVIDRLTRFYEHENSNIHRAAHTLAARATDAYEGARESVRRFVGAGSTEEIVWVRGTTEGINLIAKTWGAQNVGEGDEILITHLEHHANIVPWQQLAAATGAVLRVAPVDDRGDIILEEFARLIGPRTKIASFTAVSNALGTVTPAAEMIAIAHAHGVPVLLDAAQSVAHAPTDVLALDVDFLVLSGHKVFGPTGIGAVYAKRALWESMPPWEGGGNMIEDVTFERTIYHGPPARFEAGTGNIADAVGLGAALDYLDGWGIEAVAAYEHGLIEYLASALAEVRSVTLVGNPRHRAGAVSFVLDGWATPEVGAALDKEGIAVRSGHHCAQPILRRFGHESTVRPSLALYNTTEDVDALIAALEKIAAKRR